MDKNHLDELQNMQTTEDAMKWYGWGSPIGLSIFFLTLIGIVVIIKIVFFG